MHAKVVFCVPRFSFFGDMIFLKNILNFSDSKGGKIDQKPLQTHHWTAAMTFVHLIEPTTAWL